MRALLILALAAAGAAAAQTSPPSPPPIASESPPAGRQRLFITPMGEPIRGAEEGATLILRWFDAADSNHDGRLGRGEFRADALRWFALLDTNHDGRIDTDEVAHYENDLAPEINGGNFGDGARAALKSGNVRSATDFGGRRDHGSIAGAADTGSGDKVRRPSYDSLLRGAGRYGLLNIPEPVAGADADFDRSISRAEFLAAADRRLGMLDPEGVGSVGRDELPGVDLPKPRRKR